jgi:hypothetical protein
VPGVTALDGERRQRCRGALSCVGIRFHDSSFRLLARTRRFRLAGGKRRGFVHSHRHPTSLAVNLPTPVNVIYCAGGGEKSQPRNQHPGRNQPAGINSSLAVPCAMTTGVRGNCARKRSDWVETATHGSEIDRSSWKSIGNTQH